MTIARLAESTASFWMPVIPQIATLPRRSACWAWMIATSGFRAGTAISSSPVKGHVMGAMVDVTFGRSVPT